MMKVFRFVVILASAPLFAQSGEVILLSHYGQYGAGKHPADRTAGIEVYSDVSTAWKVFAGGALQRRFGVNDRSIGIGAYFLPDRENSFFASVRVGFSPVVMPGADISAEYTRTVGGSHAVALQYRYMGFTDVSVHILAPSVTVYALRGWMLTTRVFLSHFAGTSAVTGSLLAQVWYEPDEAWSPGISYAVGNEAYRAGALAGVTTASSWSTSIGGKVRVSESLKLRLSLEHLHRTGAYQVNSLFLSAAYGW